MDSDRFPSYTDGNNFPYFNDGEVTIAITDKEVFKLHWSVLARASPKLAGLLNDDIARATKKGPRFNVQLNKTDESEGSYIVIGEDSYLKLSVVWPRDNPPGPPVQNPHTPFSAAWTQVRISSPNAYCARTDTTPGLVRRARRSLRPQHQCRR